MKNDLWEALHDIFRKLDEYFGRERTLSGPVIPEAAGDEAELVEESSRPSEDRVLPPDELLSARSELRRELEIVRTKLSNRLSERDTYLVLFAIVAHFDELVQTRFLKGDHLVWPTLQRELFQVDDAGEVFYETLDDILLKPQTLPFVLEVYYFCLNDGFKGRYDSNPAKIAEYMERLKQKIPYEQPKSVQRIDPDYTVVETPRSPVLYYVSAAAALVLVYFVLRGAAWLWNPLLH
ncbi:MAG: DotU family type IV/VI secretion system protein [Desulfobacteraceae bacterium]|nr:DotU family type IV/VI secretion system protein [Desulfobacteraceae bacterium]